MPDSILIDNVGPAFVMAGRYGDVPSWKLIGQPDYKFADGPAQSPAMFSYGMPDLDGLVVSVEIEADAPDPAVASDAHGVPYGPVLQMGSGVTISVETTVATAQSIADWMAGGGTYNIASTTLGDYDAAFIDGAATTRLPSDPWGIGIKSLRSWEARKNNPNYIGDPHEWWFADIFPSAPSTMALKNNSGEAAQENFTFEFRARRRTLSDAGNTPGRQFHIGAQIQQSRVHNIYGDTPLWSDVLPFYF